MLLRREKKLRARIVINSDDNYSLSDFHLENFQFVEFDRRKEFFVSSLDGNFRKDRSDRRKTRRIDLSVQFDQFEFR